MPLHLHRTLRLLSFAILLVATPAHTELASEVASREIAHLLSVLENSSCDFYRNGKWHSAQRARAHLQRKFEHVSKRKSDLDAEEFIRMAASQSSMSGDPYRVRCGETEVQSATWFSDELARYRKSIEMPEEH